MQKKLPIFCLMLEKNINLAFFFSDQQPDDTACLTAPHGQEPELLLDDCLLEIRLTFFFKLLKLFKHIFSIS